MARQLHPFFSANSGKSIQLPVQEHKQPITNHKILVLQREFELQQ
ncbi:hypothetical protein HanXRQr2_Chr04g0186021 [Helianthus annuus]|uniref:Uncharacterized protein n=1 Tax=Helianthus annuus TaxID=4232 RepID=A0A9K3NSQ6_HELAN|nr:hypothetical protein HanXRQr2_Chr04g0186021 [Helianthus annuus]